MGLDQYAYSISLSNDVSEKDINEDMIDEEQYDVLFSDENQIQYWRKHNRLQGFFEELFQERGGEYNDFNCYYMELSKEDILDLFEKVISFTLPATTGFFYGSDSYGYGTLYINNKIIYYDDMGADLNFIKTALVDLEKGRRIFYNCSY